MDKHLMIYTPDLDPHSGYGRESLEMIYRLSQMGYAVNAIGDDWEVHQQHLSEPMKALLGQPLTPSLGGIAVGYPTLYEQYPLLFEGKVIARTMFESDKLPSGWSQVLNRCAAVAVPGQWMADVLKKNGVIRPVAIVPDGISETYQYVKRPRRSTFTFLAIGDRGNRKGWDLAAKAFVRAFGNDTSKKLIIKCRPGAMGGLKIENPNIEILEADLTEPQLMELYARCDAMVFPTRGEGFGLPPREFARTGGPVICTNWGGTADKLSAWGYPLRYKLVRAWDGHPTMQGLGKWAEPDLEHLIEQMQWVVSEQRWLMWAGPFRDPQSGLVHEAQSVRVATEIAKHYSWQAFAEGMERLWRKTPEPLTLAERRAKRKEARHGH